MRPCGMSGFRSSPTRTQHDIEKNPPEPKNGSWDSLHPTLNAGNVPQRDDWPRRRTTAYAAYSSSGRTPRGRDASIHLRAPVIAGNVTPRSSVGWRLVPGAVSSAPGIFSNVTAAFRWGRTGNQNIPQGRIVSQYGGAGATPSTISGTPGRCRAAIQGRRRSANPDLSGKRTAYRGLDLAAFSGPGQAQRGLSRTGKDATSLLVSTPASQRQGRQGGSCHCQHRPAMRNRGIDSTSATGVPWAEDCWSGEPSTAVTTTISHQHL